MGLKADFPYPPLCVKEDPCALRIISPAYAGREGELTAILQYVYQSVQLGKCGRENMAHTLMEIAVTEMHHLEMLGTLISNLGAPPIFAACPPYPVGYYSASAVCYAKTPDAMIAADICGERQAIAAYESMIKRLENAEVRAVIARITEDERLHLSVLEEMLKDLRRKR